MKIRKANSSDALPLQAFWLAVATVPGGIARTPDEITDTYIEDILAKSESKGLMLLGLEDGRIMAAIHAFRPAPEALHHTLSSLTVGVRPSSLGKRFGQEIFEAFLKTIRDEMPDIARVELHARASNERGLRLYESMGFVLEGRLENRVLSPHGGLEADVMMAWFNPSFDSEGIEAGNA
jgi:putative acetyltransferase